MGVRLNLVLVQALANGHNSSFKPQTDKPKLRGAGAIDLPDTGGKKKGGKGKKAAPKAEKA